MARRKRNVPKKRNHIARAMIERTGSHAGPHQNREYDERKGRIRKPKHKKSPRDPGAFDLPLAIC